MPGFPGFFIMKIEVKVITRNIPSIGSYNVIVGVLPKDADPFELIQADKVNLRHLHPSVVLNDMIPPDLAANDIYAGLIDADGHLWADYPYPQVYTVDVPSKDDDDTYHLDQQEVGCLLYVLGAEIGHLRAAYDESPQYGNEIEVYKDLAFKLNRTSGEY